MTQRDGSIGRSSARRYRRSRRTICGMPRRALTISAGANVLAVSRMLGHKDPSVTLRIYADLFDSDLDAVAVNLDAKIAHGVQSTCRPSPTAQENRCLAASMCLPAQCPRGDLPTYDTGCDLAIEAVNA